MNVYASIFLTCAAQSGSLMWSQAISKFEGEGVFLKPFRINKSIDGFVLATEFKDAPDRYLDVGTLSKSGEHLTWNRLNLRRACLVQNLEREKLFSLAAKTAADNMPQQSTEIKMGIVQIEGSDKPNTDIELMIIATTAGDPKHTYFFNIIGSKMKDRQVIRNMHGGLF